MSTLFMLNCIFWYTTLITIPYMVFGGSCAFRVTRNGPWATQECFEEVGFDSGDTVSYKYECQQDTLSGITGMTIMEYGNSFACDGDVTFQSTFTNGVHCDDNSNSCKIIKMTENFWYNENNCQGDPDDYNTWYLTEDALNCADQCYTSSPYAYKYRYDEERGLITYEWEESSGCHGEPLSTLKYLTDCEQTSTTSSRSYTFIPIPPLSKEVKCCDSSNYMTDIGVDVNAFSHKAIEDIYSTDECCSLCNDDESCLSFSYVGDEFVCYLYEFEITIDDSITISSPGTISSNKCEQEEEEEEKGCCDSSNYLYNTCHAGHGDGSRYTFAPNIDSIDKCCSVCEETEECLSFSYIPQFGCYLFETVIDNDRIDRDGCVSANKECDKKEEEEEEEELECCDSSNYLSDTSHIGTPLDLVIDVGIESVYDCCSLCDETEGCLSFTYHRSSEEEFVYCYLYDSAISDGVATTIVGDISGNRECGI